MVFRQTSVNGQRGYTLIELMIAIAVIGAISVVAIPLFITFLRAMETRGAARELATVLQQARQLAIARNTDYRVEVEVDSNRLRFMDTMRTGGTGDDVAWVGPGTEAVTGYMRLENQARLVNVTANPTFNHLGTGGASTITIQDSRSSSNARVRVTLGRIWICDTSNCP